MKFLLLCVAVLCAHLALIGWLEVNTTPRQPDVTMAPVQTRQILPSPSSHEPATPVAKHQAEPSVAPAKPDTSHHPVTPESPSPVTSGKPSNPTAPILAVGAGTESDAPPSSDKSAHATGSPSDTVSNGAADVTKGVQLPSSKAAYLNNPTPPYPILSFRLRERGKVVVRVLIGRTGQALNGQVVQSSGFARLDQAALKAALAWRYVPGKVDGQAQDMWYDVPFDFNPPD